MSSDLLEQAMIDAAALKEAAMKNAENALIEKYSAEFNQTVQKLLEQDLTDPPADAATPDTGGADLSADPSAGAPDLSAGAVDPMGGGIMGGEQNKTFSKVPGAFSGVGDDEMITINFDQIKATLNEMLGVEEAYDTKGQDPTSDALSQGKVNVKILGEKEPSINAVDVVSIGAGDAEAEAEQMEWEWELEEDGNELGGSEGGMESLEEIELEEQDVAAAGAANAARAADLEKQAAAEKAKEQTAKAAAAKEKEETEKAAANATKAASAKDAAKAGTAIPSVTETIELSEEELEELAEELRVDLKVGNLSDGYMGSTETQKREQRNVELAAARDDKATAEREQEAAKMSDLMKENAQLKNLNNDALSAVAALKEQIEKLNVLNAKLLYTNKALVNVSLNERQKTNIVESISKADSVLAAKTIYETIQNAVEGVGKEKEAPQSLRETLNKAATPFVVKKSANNSITDLMAQRMKALAGIK